MKPLIKVAFDNAISHAAFADDALVISKMNLNDGGSQPKMRDTTFNGAEQKMVYPNRMQKVMKTILTGKGLFKERLRKVCSECKTKASREQNEEK